MIRAADRGATSWLLAAARGVDGWLVPSLAGVAALVVVCVLGRPWLGPSNDPDSMNSVLYFQRIAAGHRLEVTVLTTPKPLLTLLYGGTWQLTGSWSSVVWETVAVHAVGVALAARLAARLAGFPAGLFLAVALALYPAEATEVLHANSLPYAVVGWSAAGLAATARPPRWGLAGSALLVAGLARTETLLILVAATLAIVIVAAVQGVRSRLPRSVATARSAAPILVGWLAVPLQALHDVLLTGNPFYTPSVPTAYTELVTPGLSSTEPLAFAHGVVGHYAATPIVVILAIGGLVYLLLSRRWAVGLGLVALTLGGLLLLGYLAWRGIYVSVRYYEEPTLGLVFLSAVGVGAGLNAIRGRLPIARRRSAAVLWAAGVVCLGVAAPAMVGVTVHGLDDVVGRTRMLQAAGAHLEVVEPRLREIVSVSGPTPPAVQFGDSFLRADPASAAVFVPGPLLGRIAVDTGAPLTRLGDLSLAFRSAPPATVVRAGQVVYHDPLLDSPASTFRIFEIDRPEALGDKTMTPLVVAPEGFWLIGIGG